MISSASMGKGIGDIKETRKTFLEVVLRGGGVGGSGGTLEQNHHPFDACNDTLGYYKYFPDGSF